MALTDILPGGAGSVINQAASSKWNPVNMALNGRAALDEMANNYLVKPASAQGISGFLFDYDGETQIVVDDDITDHYTESNRFFQDHDAHKPIEITMRGFVAELAQKAPQGITGALSILQNKLTTLPSLLGKYTPGALSKVQGVVNSATNTVNKLDNLISRAKNIVGLIAGGSAAPTKQAQAFGKLMALRDTSQVFNLVTPFGLMAARDPITGKAGPRTFVIKHLVFIQTDETKDWADIAVTLKEVRFAEVNSSAKGQSPAAALQNNAGRAAFQRMSQTIKGKTQGLATSFSKLSGAFG
jgi:hypothetical protein